MFRGYFIGNKQNMKINNIIYKNQEYTYSRLLYINIRGIIYALILNLNMFLQILPFQSINFSQEPSNNLISL